MTNGVFEAQGFHKVSEYFGFTMTNVVVNIFHFGGHLPHCAYRDCCCSSTQFNYATPLPVLRRFDSLAGGAVGLLRGFLGMFALFMIVPV